MTISIHHQIPAQHLPKDDTIRLWAQGVLDAEASKKDLSIAFVASTTIQSLNLQYRDKNAPTNVLAFPTDCDESTDHDSAQQHFTGNSNLLGEIVLCAEVIAQEAAELGIEVEAHFAHIIIHGTLHCCGYDHIEKKDARTMESKEIHYLAQHGIENPYEMD